MIKTTLAASAVAVVLAAAPAFAQTSPSTTMPSAQPMTPAQPAQTMPAQPATGAAAAMPATGAPRFFTAMEADQWRASKFTGVDIYGANNEKIGDVDDVILDRQGNIEAVVIGVGGFLGIGEKPVALPFAQIEWMTGERTSASAAPARTDGSAAPATRTTANAPAATAANTDVTGSTVRAGARMDYPSYGLLRMTKQDLQNAPTYRYGEDQTGTTAPATTAPRP